MVTRSRFLQNRAIFLDRDGVINPLIYFKEEEIIDTPLSENHFKLLPNVGNAIKLINKLGFKAIIISNQPGIAKNKFSKKELDNINKKMLGLLKRKKAVIDGIYYCLHHPEAVNKQYKKICKCRKPKQGLILQAAKVHNIDLKNSFMIGDNISDMKAGKAADCKTIFIGTFKCDHCRLLQKENMSPDFIAKDLFEAVKLISHE